MGDSFVTSISIRSKCTSNALVSVMDGDTEYARFAISAACRDVDKPADIIENRTELHLCYPVLISNPRVTSTGADIGRWHLKDGVMEINLE